MCFSAGASFTTAVVLTLVGVMTLFQVRARSQFLFALIPLLFALQQFAEGFVWLALKGGPFAYLEGIMVVAFLFFAFVIWPTWIPLSVAVMETHETRKRALSFMILIGLAISAILAASLWFYPPSADIRGHHIMYQVKTIVDFMGNAWLLVAYCIPVIGSFFISDNRWLRLFGIGALASAFTAHGLWAAWFTSVWCFFAAVLSVFVYLIIRLSRRV
jgi:hypothetical protein